MAIVGELGTFSEFADVDAMRRLAAFAGTMEDRDRSLLVSDASPIMQACGR